MRARALITAISTDEENVYMPLSARSLRPDLVSAQRDKAEVAGIQVEFLNQRAQALTP